MADEIRLDHDVATRLAAMHRDAERLVEKCADSLPSTSLDGGEGTRHFEAILASHTKQASQIAEVNAAAATALKETAAEFSNHEQESQDAIERIRSQLGGDK